MTDAIAIHRLTKCYGSRRVVDNLSLRVPEGTVYGLLGRNGAGKSTAIKMLVGMVRPDRAARRGCEHAGSGGSGTYRSNYSGAGGSWSRRRSFPICAPGIGLAKQLRDGTSQVPQLTLRPAR